MPAKTAEGPLLGGRYRVIERLGSGGMAAVYLAHDERLDRRVAVKRLHAGRGDDMDGRRFEREAKIGASLSHPNLVSIFDTLHDDEAVLLVMEYVEGETLADLLARGPIEPKRAVAIVRAVAGALDHAHASGIVHRDIKPGNVLLGDDGAVKLADLGIAKAVERTEITGTGTVLGTPAYMAPEQLEGGKLGPAVDIYALATMAFEMLTGKRARRGRTAVEIAHQVVNEPTPDAHEANPAVPPAAAEAIRVGMASDPGDRPSSAVALADRLEQAFDRTPPVERVAATRPLDRARPATPPATPQYRRIAPGRRRGWPLAALGLIAVALAALVIGLTSGGEDEPQQAADTPAAPAEKPKANEEESPSPLPAPEEEAAPEEAAPEETPAEPAPTEGVPQPQGKGGSAKAEQHHLKGHAALEAGDYDKAIKENTRAIEAFPPGTTWESDMNYAYALYSLGRALRLAGRPDEAIPVLEARAAIPDQQATVQRELEAARADAGNP